MFTRCMFVSVSRNRSLLRRLASLVTSNQHLPNIYRLKTADVGQCQLILQAWSNGRMRSAVHRVMMSGDKDRYSLAIFGAPVDGSIIKAPKELIDEEHPQVFKEFDYLDFVKFRNSEEGRATDSEMQMFAFAGI